MNRRTILTFSAITALALVPGSVVAQQESLKQQLVGTWTLVSCPTTVAYSDELLRIILIEAAVPNPGYQTAWDERTKASVEHPLGRFFVLFVPEAPSTAASRRGGGMLVGPPEWQI
jgi:hypothetical protein